MLQAILLLIAVVPLVTGLLGILPPGVSSDFYGTSLRTDNPGHVILDSNYRYYSGLWLGIGLVMLWIIPSVEKQKLALRMLSLMIFLGGLGRVLSMVTFGIPHPAFIFFTGLELAFPLSLLWQARLVQAQ